MSCPRANYILVRVLNLYSSNLSYIETKTQNLYSTVIGMHRVVWHRLPIQSWIDMIGCLAVVTPLLEDICTQRIDTLILPCELKWMLNVNVKDIPHEVSEGTKTMAAVFTMMQNVIRVHGRVSFTLRTKRNANCLFPFLYFLVSPNKFNAAPPSINFLYVPAPPLYAINT